MNQPMNQPANPHRADEQPLSEAAQASYFEQVLCATKLAEVARGRVCVRIDLAGTQVDLVFAGAEISDVYMPALAHLVVEPLNLPSLTIHVWDSERSGIEMPPPPVSRDCFSNRGDIWRMDSARFRSAFHWIESSVNLMDVESSEAVHWVPSTVALPYWAKASPFRTLFHWWLESTGAQLLHGAAIGDDNGAVLLTGRGGVGKSTTALTALTHGLQYVGDDYLAVRLEPEPRVYSLYCTAKLNGAQMLRFPQLEGMISNHGFSESEKAVVRLWPTLQSQVRRSMPLRAIATPVFSGTPETSFATTTRLALQRAASYTTMAQLPRAGALLHSFMHRLVHRVPGFTLRLGSDLAAIPGVLSGFLARPDAELTALASAGDADVHQPLVSVIIPVFNGAHFLHDAVASVLSQHYSQAEIIVVDDGSTDDLLSAISDLPVEVRLLKQENCGPASARNRGIRDAGGEFLAFLDVDDLWPPGNLDRMIRLLRESPDAMVVHGRGQMMRRGENGQDEFIGDPTQVFPHYIGAGVYRQEAFAKVGLFDPNLRFGEDGDWFNRAREVALPILEIDEVCLFLRRHGQNMTHGKSMVELNSLRVMKLALDRHRAAQLST